jgi:hypothetical protein
VPPPLAGGLTALVADVVIWAMQPVRHSKMSVRSTPRRYARKLRLSPRRHGATGRRPGSRLVVE